MSSRTWWKLLTRRSAERTSVLPKAGTTRGSEAIHDVGLSGPVRSCCYELTPANGRERIGRGRHESDMPARVHPHPHLVGGAAHRRAIRTSANPHIDQPQTKDSAPGRSFGSRNELRHEPFNAYSLAVACGGRGVSSRHRPASCSARRPPCVAPKRARHRIAPLPRTRPHATACCAPHARPIVGPARFPARRSAMAV